MRHGFLAFTEIEYKVIVSKFKIWWRRKNTKIRRWGDVAVVNVFFITRSALSDCSKCKDWNITIKIHFVNFDFRSCVQNITMSNLSVEDITYDVICSNSNNFQLEGLQEMKVWILFYFLFLLKFRTWKTSDGLFNKIKIKKFNQNLKYFLNV